MAPSSTQRSTKAKKAAPAAGRSRPAKKGATSERKPAVARTAELSDDVLRSIEAGQRAAIEAVHKFTETVDEALPSLGERPSRRETVIDAALEMADQLVHTQYDFLRSVVRSAEESLSRSDGAKAKE